MHAAASLASAAMITSSAAFDGMAASTVDFNMPSAIDGQPISNQSMFAGQGIMLPFAGGLDGGEAFTLDADSSDTGSPNARIMHVYGPASPIEFPGQPFVTGEITIDFIEPVDLIGFEYTVGFGQALTVEAYTSDDLANPIAEYSIAAPAGSDGFLGVDLRGIQTFNRIVLHDSSYNFTMDDLMFADSSGNAPVPAPGAMLLAVIGLGAVSFVSRRFTSVA